MDCCSGSDGKSPSSNHEATTAYFSDWWTPTPEFPLAHPTRITVTNAAGHTLTTRFNGSGIAYVRRIPSSAVDANLNTTSYTYDPLGRIIEARQPTEADGPASWTFSYDVDPNKSQVPVIHTAQLQDTNGPGGSARYLNTWVVYDSLFRERQTHVLSPASTTANPKTIVTDTTYDSRGLVWATGSPEPVDGAPGQALLPTPAGGWTNRTQTAYDHAARPSWVVDWYDDGDSDTNADDVYRMLTPTYTHNSVDSRWLKQDSTGVGTRTRTITDAYGRTSSEDEHDGTAWRPTSYTYDAADRLKTVTDPANNKITYTYDMAGRRTAMDDPDAGDWTYGYDLAGNQTTVTDATNAAVRTDYDALNRPTVRYMSSPSSPLVTWAYDAPDELGLLNSSTRHTSGGSWIMDVAGYDGRNRPTGRSWEVPASVTGLGGKYSVSYGYDAADHQTSIKYPTVGGLLEETVTTTYNSVGLPTNLAGTEQYVSAFAYDERGRPKRFGYGNPSAPMVSREWNYDNNQRLSHQVAATPAGTVQDRTISYDIVGNVTERNTILNGGAFRECYGYDQRDRLTAAYTTSPSNTCASGAGKGTGANPYNHQYTYTVDGNLKTRVEGGTTTTYTYPAGGGNSTRPHAPTAVGSNTYTWNANGNEATRTIGSQTQTFNWDAEHRLASITSPTGNSSYLHDPDGQRLLRTTPQGRTLYIEGHEITAPTTGATTAVRSYGMGGQPLATRSTAGGVDFLTSDNQGSVELTVGAGTSGTPEVVRTYLPYGEVRTGGQLETDHAWIGQVEDDHTGLQYLNARYYDPAIGIFTAADAVYDLGRPQTLNPFNYSMSNPVTHSDPTGLDSPYDYTGRSQTAPAQAASQFRGSGPGEPSTHESVSLIEREQEKRKKEADLLDQVMFEANVIIGHCAVVGLHSSTCGIYDPQWDLRGDDPLHGLAHRIARWLIERALENGTIHFADGLLQPGNCGGDNYCPMGYMEIGDMLTGMDTSARREAAMELVALADMFGSLGYGSLGGAACSFAADVRIVMADGTTKRIADVREGDMVLAADPETGETGAREILATMPHTDQLMTLRVSSGEIVTTEDHRYWNDTDQQWQESQDLDPGDSAPNSGRRLFACGGSRLGDAPHRRRL